MKTDSLAAQQLYPPEPPLSFPPSTRDALADQLYPPEPPLSFPPLDVNVNDPGVAARGLRAEAQALTTGDLSSLSVGHATTTQRTDPFQLYVAGALLTVVVGVVLAAVARRKEKSKTNDAKVTFTDSYEPFLG